MSGFQTQGKKARHRIVIQDTPDRQRETQLVSPAPWQGERCRNCSALPTLPTYKLSAFTWGRQKKTRGNQCMVQILITNHISFRKIIRNTEKYCHQILNLTNITIHHQNYCYLLISDHLLQLSNTFNTFLC